MLRKISGNVLLIPGRTNIGIIVIDDRECLIIDSGIDDDSGRKIVNTLVKSGFKIRALVLSLIHI